MPWSTNRKFLKFSVAVLNLLFLLPSENSYEYDKLRLFKDTLLILSVMPCAIPILTDFCLQLYDGISNLTALTENLIALNCIIGMIYMIVCFIQNRRLILKLVIRLNEFKQYGDPDRIIAIDDKANLYSKVFLLYGVLGNVIYMLMPQLTVEKCRENRPEQMIRDGIPCGLVTRCRFPFKFDYTPIFEIVFLHQIYTCTMVTIVILVLTMLLCGLLMHTVQQLGHLKIVFGVFERENSMKNLHYCVEYHIDIIKFSQDINKAFSNMMLLHLTLTSVVISVLCFEVIMVDNFTDSLRFACHLFGWLVLLLLICYYAQQLIDESSSISSLIYYGPWLESNVEVRKDLLMVLMRSQRPLTLSAANLGAMSLPTFLRVMSSAYSFFTLLLKLKS